MTATDYNRAPQIPQGDLDNLLKRASEGIRRCYMIAFEQAAQQACDGSVFRDGEYHGIHHPLKTYPRWEWTLVDPRRHLERSFQLVIFSGKLRPKMSEYKRRRLYALDRAVMRFAAGSGKLLFYASSLKGKLSSLNLVMVHPDEDPMGLFDGGLFDGCWQHRRAKRDSPMFYKQIDFVVGAVWFVDGMWKIDVSTTRRHTF